MLTSNKLWHVNDSKGFQNANDLDDQGTYPGTPGAGNYVYDETGNLLTDAKEDVSDITWDHYGKVRKVERDASSGKDRLWFEYDATGNRVKKTVWPEGSIDTEDRERQYYVRDPQGNVIALYRLTEDSGNDVFRIEERHIYGSERLGIWRKEFELYNAPTGSGVASTNRTALLEATGEKTVVISEVLYKSPLGTENDGEMLILRNISDRRVELDGLQVGDAEAARFFEIPEGIALDSAERVIIAFGEATMQTGLIDTLDLDTLTGDTTVHWVWQDRYELPDSGARVTLVAWTDSTGEAIVLDALDYESDPEIEGHGEGVLRRYYARTESRYVADDFEAGTITGLGSPQYRDGPGTGFNPFTLWRKDRGEKVYELKDHLGNVTVVVTDRRLPVEDQVQTGEVAYFEAEVVAARDYYPFGMLMPGRVYSATGYRYGFNGEEMDDQWHGAGNSLDFGARIYDPRLGRFVSIDPYDKFAPGRTPFSFAANDPVLLIDRGGKWPEIPESWWKGKTYAHGFIAGMVNAGGELLNMTWESAFLNPTTVFFYWDWLIDGGRRNRTFYERSTFLLKLATDSELREKAWKNLEEALGQYIDDFTGENGPSKAGYAHGTAAFDLLVGLIAVEGYTSAKLISLLKNGGDDLKNFVRKISNIRVEAPRGQLGMFSWPKISFKYANVPLKCNEFAKEFIQKTRRTMDELGATVTRKEYTTNNPYGIGYGDNPITKNGYHTIVEVSKDGRTFIFDNIHPNGITKEEFLEKILVIGSENGRPKEWTREAAYELFKAASK